MKNFLRITLVFCFLDSNASAFTLDNSDYGFILGVGSSSLSTSTANSSSSGLGVIVGVDTSFKIDEKLSLISGFGFAQRKISNSGSVATTNFFEIPVMVRMRLSSSPSYAFLQAGAIYGHLISVVVDGNSTSTASLHRGVLSLPFGVGAMLPVNKDYSFSVAINYQLGVSNIYSTGSTTGRYNVVSLTLGLRFFDSENDTNLEARAREFLYRKKKLKDPHAVWEGDATESGTPLLEQAEGVQELSQEVPTDIAVEEVNVAEERNPTDSVTQEVPVEEASEAVPIEEPTTVVPAEDLPNE